MYSFGPIPRQQRSGRVIGTHQKIDRVARRHLSKHIVKGGFPGISEILHFEGTRGPDGVKLKSPGKDEPRHFIDPKSFGANDQLLLGIEAHIHNLSEALKTSDTTRAAFEAAWLAHAVTDGLTPAHHVPFDEELKELRMSDELPQRFRNKFIITGNGSKQFIRSNWHYWGAKGLMTTHTLFEAGVATAAKPLQFKDAAATQEEISDLHERGFTSVYADMIRMIDELDMYDRFKRDGWTRMLAKQTTGVLVPTIIHAVELAWLAAYTDAKDGHS